MKLIFNELVCISWNIVLYATSKVYQTAHNGLCIIYEKC